MATKITNFFAAMLDVGGSWLDAILARAWLWPIVCVALFLSFGRVFVNHGISGVLRYLLVLFVAFVLLTAIFA